MPQDESIRCLVIEDESGVRSAIVEMIRHDRRIGEILEAKTLAEAFHILERERVSVIVADLRLPDSDGADTVECLVIRFPEIPVVVLTALDLNRPLVDALVVAGAFAFMSKDSLFRMNLTDWISKAHLYSKCQRQI